MEIDFFPKSMEAEVLVPKPKPARFYAPQWFTEMPAFVDNKFAVENDGNTNATAKLCVPLSDAFSMGYIQETWCDFYINIDSNGNFTGYHHSSQPNMVHHRRPVSSFGDHFHNVELLWQLQWTPQLPDGYSMLYTHPLNRPELPFFSFSGIVDSDKFKYEKDANHPFLLKKGFGGIIPKGTPIVQMIPFKRDEWEANFLHHDERKQLQAELPRQKYWGGYKKLFWTKKSFK